MCDKLMHHNNTLLLPEFSSIDDRFVFVSRHYTVIDAVIGRMYKGEQEREKEREKGEGKIYEQFSCKRDFL